MKNKPLIIFILFSSAIIFFTALFGMVIWPEHRDIGEIEIENVKIASIPDGTYYGRAETIMAAAEVIVIIEEGRIADINLVRHVHSNGEMAEVVLDKIMEKQNLEVDTVSEATISSLILMKAVEDALIEKEKEFE